MVFMAGMTPTPGIPGMPSPGTPAGATAAFGQLSAQYGGGTGAPAPFAAPTDIPLLYMGLTKPSGSTAYGEDVLDWAMKTGTTDTRQPKIATLNDAIRKFDNMTLTEQRNMLRLLAIGGFAGSISLEDIDEAVKEASQLDARDAYMSLLERASEYFMTTGAQVTPNDVLKSAIAYRLEGMGINWDGKLSTFDDGIPKSYLTAAEAAGEDPLKPFSTTTTSTSRSVDLMSPMDAKGLTRQMLQQELGRDPTQAEYEDFLSALHAAERQNPTISKTTTTSHYGVNDAGQHFLEDSNTNTVSRGGLTSAGYEQILTEQAQANPDWAEWQAVGTYFPALLSALGATVPGA